MAYNIDLHCHSWFSGDGVSSPEGLIESAKRKGLHGFAMTDHNTSDACRYMLDKGLLREDGATGGRLSRDPRSRSDHG
jgi:histidinol phosphatase-like PHP family hydrolase